MSQDTMWPKYTTYVCQMHNRTSWSENHWEKAEAQYTYHLVIDKFWQMIQNACGRSITQTATIFYTEASAKNCTYKGYFILIVTNAMTK